MAALEYAGLPVLRSMAEGATHPLESACFPLIPYCNRIADGKFGFGSHQVSIAPNFAGQHHPLHGLGWLSAWRVVRNEAASVLLEHAHDGCDEWPWAYVAHQHIALDSNGCTVRLLVQNLSAEPAPIGLGLHPYFRRGPDTEVTFEAAAMLGVDAEFLPTDEVFPADEIAAWSLGTSLPAVLVDNTFSGWSGTAQIADRLGAITVRSFGTPHCHVFAPPDGTALCIEPVNHLPDAVNRAPDQMPIVQPGCAAGIAMRIETIVA